MIDVNNVSELISYQAKINGHKKSIVYPKRKFFRYKNYSYTFSELDKRVNKIANKLVKLGVKPGDKVLFFVKPNLDFCAITFALFRMGAISVFIDPGMKRQYFLDSISKLKPDVLIGIPSVHFIRQFFKKNFQSIKVFITTGKFGFSQTHSLYAALERESEIFTAYNPLESDLAAILYTSGGTGKPKGVEYNHSIFINQTKMLKNEFSLTSDDIDIPGFPLFSFFTLSMGMTSVIPDMDASKPAKCNPKKLYKNIISSKATFIAGSPAIWERLCDYCLKSDLSLEHVKYVVMFGAPVRNQIHLNFSKILPNGTTYTPYGATECLPVANISGKYILENTAHLSDSGLGTCVGVPLEFVNVKIIKQVDSPIEDFSRIEELASYEVGEIIVSSPNVTKAYYQMDQETKNSKIYDGDLVWHRMGDVGYVDDNNKLWFCGRKKHVVKIDSFELYPIQIEAFFNKHPNIKRSALIYLKDSNSAGIVIEPNKSLNSISQSFRQELLEISNSIQSKIKIEKFYLKNKFPVDVRHNIKIDRTLLSKEFSGVL